MSIDPDEILGSVWDDLIQAAEDRRHAYRRLVLATSSKSGIRQRIVILRKVIRHQGLVCYTDSRSQKMKDIETDDGVHALLYDDTQKIQLSCTGSVEPYEDPSVQLSSQESAWYKDYTTKLSPGTPIELHQEVEYDKSQVHFSSFIIQLTTIEYLRLSRDGHVRLLFSKSGDDWTAQRLVP